MNSICLRDATLNDEMLVYKWRNIEGLVALSSKQKKVTLNEHKEWFRKKLLDRECSMLIIQLNDKNIGLIRLELEKKMNCKVSIYIIPGYEGQGFGYTALSQVIKSGKIKSEFYEAEVQISNVRSQKFFKKLGFSQSSINNSDILFKKRNLL